jgi:hypothetical protein
MFNWRNLIGGDVGLNEWIKTICQVADMEAKTELSSPRMNVKIIKREVELQAEVKLRLRSQSTSVSWCPASFWNLWPDFCFLPDICEFSCSASSVTRAWVCNLHVELVLELAKAVTLRSKCRRIEDHILLPHLRLPNLEGQAPVFKSPISMLAQFFFRRQLGRWRSSNPLRHGSITTEQTCSVYEFRDRLEPWNRKVWSTQSVVCF